MRRLKGLYRKLNHIGRKTPFGVENCVVFSFQCPLKKNCWEISWQGFRSDEHFCDYYGMVEKPYVMKDGDPVIIRCLLKNSVGFIAKCK